MADARPVLVTGPTGFLGMHLVRRLIAGGTRVRALGRNPNACHQLADLGCEMVRADLRDLDALKNPSAGCEHVCHAGALSSLWGSKRDFWKHNVEGTSHVLTACERKSMRGCGIISSPRALVY